MIAWEAVCKKCGETFNPVDEDDLIHLYRFETEEECGGEGEMTGRW
jgi:hypothetical protein